MLVTFPILVWLGVEPRIANATGAVALWPGLLGAVWGYRHAMQGSRTILLRLSFPSVMGGACMQESEETRCCCNLFYVNCEKMMRPETRNAEVRDSNDNAICFRFQITNP